jgi:hypothetical protein
MNHFRPLIRCGLVLVTLLPNAATATHPTAPNTAFHSQSNDLETRVGGHLLHWWQARVQGDTAAMTRALHQGGGALQRMEGRDWLLVQLHRAGSDPNQPLLATWQDADVAALVAAMPGQLRVQTVGLDLLDALVAVDALPQLLAVRQIGFVQLPWRGHPLVGPQQSEGAPLLDSPQRQCRQAAGQGQVVAVLDAGFEGLSAARASGELPNVISPPGEAGGSHGTMCSEVVADVAPAATIWPVSAPSFSGVQALAKHISQGNQNSVDVISHSVAWFGMSYGRHMGAACQMVDLARTGGAAWVNASGNNGGGKFFQAEWNDKDGDGDLDLADGTDVLRFAQYWGPLQVVVDWDDYEARKVNLDLQLVQKQEDGSWKEVAKSSLKHGKYVPPMENFAEQGLDDGVYGLRIVAKTAVPAGMRVRAVKLSDGQSDFSLWSEHGSIYDPGNCKGVLTVGAAYHGEWTTAPKLESYSSFGPLVDGRQKPELVAPTGVATSVGAFYGTSAACPHAAGAVAVVAGATGLSSTQAVALLAAEASPVTAAVPDARWGAGLLRLSPAAVGYACDPAASAVLCTTTCGSAGLTVCSQTCAITACTPPAESCNGADDNCDGATDEGCMTIDAGSQDSQLDTSADAVAEPTAQVRSSGDSGCNSGRFTSPLAGWMVLAAGLLVRLRRYSVSPSLHTPD